MNRAIAGSREVRFTVREIRAFVSYDYHRDVFIGKVKEVDHEDDYDRVVATLDFLTYTEALEWARRYNSENADCDG